MARGIPPIQRGDVITAKRLNEYGDNINNLKNKAFDGPAQTEIAPDPDVQSAVEDDVEAEAVEADVFIEVSRTSSQVQVFDQNDENYALIDRIDTVTFINGDGDTLKLQFTN